MRGLLSDDIDISGLAGILMSWGNWQTGQAILMVNYQYL